MLDDEMETQTDEIEAPIDEVELTDDEIDAVNVVIENIKTELDISILNIKNDDFNSAVENVENGIDITDCELCKRELGVLKADIEHAHAVCELGHETCEEEKEIVIDTATELKDDFIPIKVEKKAVIEKRKQQSYY